jgi:hypothetical protein
MKRVVVPSPGLDADVVYPKLEGGVHQPRISVGKWRPDEANPNNPTLPRKTYVFVERR